MSEPSRSAPPPAPSEPSSPSPSPRNYVDFFLYLSAAVSYISLSIYNKWLLDWIVGPLWLVAWVWGLPAIVKLIRRQPVRPQRNPIGGNPTEDPELEEDP
jgi:hypothetical protein